MKTKQALTHLQLLSEMRTAITKALPNLGLIFLNKWRKTLNYRLCFTAERELLLMILCVARIQALKKINIATATFDSVEHTVKDAYKNDKISGYYDLQAAEVDGAYQNAKRHILIFGTDNKA